ncbi:uncharacterized protein [Euwallacea fornicatus]|uniref:uncharacterized protein isoform X3 n=1 Tax=Euwallacea fornicatus TaxID=995702 RepID=UPI00338F5F9B
MLNYHVMSPKKEPAIVIVGAGAAGIAAATKLISHGFSNVVVLEAENRIGGRIHSIPFEGTTVELGAQWIHGEEGNAIYDMVKDLGLVDHPKSSTYHDLTYFTSGGDKLNKNLTDRLHEIACNIAEDIETATKSRTSLKQYFHDQYDAMVDQKYGVHNKEIVRVATMIKEWYCKFYLCMDPADSLDAVAVDSLFMYQEVDGDHLIHWKTNGYSTIFDVMMDKANVSVKDFMERNVKLNKVVNKIKWIGENVEVHSSDGSIFLADHVILTVSIGVLKQNHVKWFEPSLPSYKINCIDNIPLGCCQKIILKFPIKWWPNEVKDFSFVWTENDRKRLLEEFPIGPIHNGRSWLEDIFGFYTVDSHPNILLGWLVGPMNREVELLDDDVVLNASMFLLKKFVGSHYKIVEPTNILRSKWGTNPNFLGTYSYVGVETQKKGVTREELAKPLVFNGKEMVLFAGEATIDKFFSTVHGAVESGNKAAERLIKIYQHNQHYQFIIVGAGMAGLGAATKLSESGLNNFLILESQDQPGGRVRTIYIDGKPLDLGAQWIHGKDNLLYKLAVENDLLEEEQSVEGIGEYVRSNGDVVDPFIVELVSFTIGKILEDCAKLAKSEEPASCLKEYLEEHFSQYLQEQVLDDREKEIFRELYDWHVRFQVIDNSCTDLSRLSSKRWGDYECLEDEAHSNFKFGYESLIKLIMERLPINDSVRYNCEVVDVGFTEDEKVEVKLKDGGSLVCEHLILTPSLGVLKESMWLSNVFPLKLIDNIANMGFAAISKIFLFYDCKWWGDSKGFQLLWGKDYVFEEHNSWLKQITGFDEVFHHDNALMTWVGGDSVQKVETLHIDVIAKQCTQFLQKFLLNYTVPMPNKVIRTQWLSNRFVKGSYCHITPECDSPESGIRVLMEPVMVGGVPRIVLAGEAAHSAHYSTTHGAFESGFKQAQILCDYVNHEAR